MEGASALESMSLTISSPSTGGTVSPNFSATGQEAPPRRDPVTKVSGTMQNAANLVNGDVTKQPTSTDGGFVIKFLSVPIGKDYTLTVTDVAGDQTQVANLSVQ